MNKSALAKQIAAGITTIFIAASPVYAETMPSRSDTVNPMKAEEAAIHMTQPEGVGNAPAEKDMATAAEAAVRKEAAPVSAAELIAPYLGKKISKISIEGNTTVSEAEIMKAVISKPGLNLTQEGLAMDMRSIYSMGWFYGIRPVFKEVPEGVQLTYEVQENPPFERLEVKGNTVFHQEYVDKLLSMPKGEIMNLKNFNLKLQELENQYKKNGYILTRITNVDLRPDGTLFVEINEGIVEDFKVKGNVKTKDYVILREMRMKKGQPFNAMLAKRSMQRVYNLGFFEDVNVRLNPGKNPNSVEVEISVVEMNTGTFGIGAGYSDADGFIGMISLGDKNFRGTGDSINARWEFGGADNKNYEFGYTRPWLDKKETAASFSLYNLKNEYADYDRHGEEIARYDKKRVGQELTFSRGEGEFVRNYITLKNRNDKYEGAKGGYSTQYYEPGYQPREQWEVDNWDKYKDFEKRRADNFGKTHSIGLSRVYDSRDNIYDPHTGKRNSWGVEHGGFGGDFEFTKFTTDYRYYFAQAKNVIAVDLTAGYAAGHLPLSQRFAVGGSNTLRGYKDDQFKGNSMLRGSLEYRIPLIKKVQGVLFVDSGYAWDKRFEDKFDLSKIETGYGVGLRVSSPLGPIKLDYGWGSDGGRFHFSFGGQF